MSEREFPVVFDPKKGAIVDLPTVCPLCRVWIGPSYDVHMVMAHPETREQPVRPLDEKPKKGKKRR